MSWTLNSIKNGIFLILIILNCTWHTECLNTQASGTTTPSMKQDVFKNITLLLDNLLKDYDNSQHPNFKQGKPTLIRTNIYIRSLGPVSEVDMYWRDPRLRFTGPVTSLSLSIKMLEKLWRPDTFFRNGRHSYVHTITVPNKLLRISQEGDITYSMRLTIKAKCKMCLESFPLDKQACPLTFGSYAFNSRHIVYSWASGGDSVSFVPNLALSQFDLISSPYLSLNITTNDGEYSFLQVNFNLERHAGYFLINVYIPSSLIVVLSWVSFWINREATSDRVGLGITAFLTLSTISLDTRTDLPKVHYATALDWFLIMSFLYCMASLLEFAFVHYFTKIGSGEIFMDEDNEDAVCVFVPRTGSQLNNRADRSQVAVVYSMENELGWDSQVLDTDSKSMESKETQTEKKTSCFRQLIRCVRADVAFRRERQKAAAQESSSNSVSKIDQIARILFPLSFLILNIFYWTSYAYSNTSCNVKN